MGIRFSCPNGHKLNVKEHLAGKRGVCPACGAKFEIPAAGQSAPSADQLPSTAAAPAQGEMPRADASNSASIVIAITDAPPPSAPVVAPAAPVLPTAPVLPSVNVKAPPPSPTIVPPAATAPMPEKQLPETEFDPPPAAVSKYAAHRRRSRRLQTTIAIALLVAVVVLGVVLIWVLSRGPRGPEASALSHNKNHVRNSEAELVVKIVNHCTTA
jgi:hypothetical protein